MRREVGDWVRRVMKGPAALGDDAAMEGRATLERRTEQS
jgi:hypothetical protein